MKKHFITTILLSMLCEAVFASKAWNQPLSFLQPDGTYVTVILHGDEYGNWYTSTDGKLLARKGNYFYVAETSQNGSLIPSDIVAHNSNQRTPSETKAYLNQNYSSFSKRQSMLRAIVKREAISASGYVPHSGKIKVAVILADFSDIKFTLPDPKKSFNQFFNGVGAPQNFGNYENRNVASVSQYFADQSKGAFTPTFDVYGPVHLPHSESYYGGNNRYGQDSNYRDVITDAVQLMSDSINLNTYDNMGTGQADLVYVIFAGYGENYGAPSSTLWAKSFPYAQNNIRYAGISSELLGISTFFKTPHISGIGVFCHEFSHTLGLPDFYNTVYTDSIIYDNQGMEDWSLMDNGDNVYNGWCPTAYTPWEREAMGWATIDSLQTAGQVKLTNIDEDGKAYRIVNPNNNKEYWIVQYVQNKGWNKYLGGNNPADDTMKVNGLLLYHVDYDSYRFSLSGNTVNTEIGHPRMTVVPADGLLMSSYRMDGTNTYQDQIAGDVFTSGDSITANQSLINYLPWTGTYSMPIYNINTKNDALYFDFLNKTATTGINLNLSELGSQSIYYSLDGKLIKHPSKGQLVIEKTNNEFKKLLFK